jgi:hypothetical protein
MFNLKLAIILFAFTTLLVACASPSPSPTVQAISTTDLSSSTPAPSFATTNPTKTLAAQATPSPADISTPTLTIPPYITKQVILEYTRSRAALGMPDEYFDPLLGNSPTTKLVIYSDRQLVLQTASKSMVTKVMTDNEIQQLLYKVDQLGFHTIDTNQKHDDTDSLYKFEGRYLEVGVTDGAFSCLSIEGDKMCYYEPYADFLIPQVKLLFQFLDSYTPGNFTAYEPDRILLFVSLGQDLSNSFVEQPMASIPWPSDLLSLGASQENYIYLEGADALKFFSLGDGIAKPMIFSENGKDYSLLPRIMLPHETVLRP